MKAIAAVDVGGTFTDLAFWDHSEQRIRIHKLLTTPQDPTIAIAEGLATWSCAPELVVHGTTLVTNALIERRGASTGLITTAGYRDVLEIGSELRYDTFDLFLERPHPLVPRHLRLTVTERTGATGEEVLPLDEAAVREAGQQLADAGVAAIGVAFLNSYRNAQHERQAVEILREVCPDAMVCSSADIAPEIREYERFSTVAANAYVQPLASRYLDTLAEKVGVPLMVILSDGGITSARSASERPIALLESGPAAGAMSAAHAASANGWGDLIAFDMGGTTAKVSLVHAGRPDRTHAMEVARVHRFKKGSGLPVRVPTVNLIEIGAGGGSIAAVDALGLLKVGPQSAGADPGPACYGRGGQQPTVTDADLMLGYLSSDSFLGGTMKLDVGAAEKAFDALAGELRVDRLRAAAGVVEIVNNNMATAARLHIAEQGRDPRHYRMIAFGGAGPVHAYDVARLLNVRQLVFQRGAGVASAIGMLVAPRSVERTASLVVPLDAPDWSSIQYVLDELERDVRGVLQEAGVDEHDIELELAADMRYIGQGYEVTVPLAIDLGKRADAAELTAAFAREYRTRFDRSLPDMPAEVVSWRVRGLSSAAVNEVIFGGGGLESAPRGKSTRPVYFAEAGGFIDTPVYQCFELDAGESIVGPALVEEPESTVVVGPAGVLTVDQSQNLILTIGRHAPD